MALHLNEGTRSCAASLAALTAAGFRLGNASEVGEYAPLAGAYGTPLIYAWLVHSAYGPLIRRMRENERLRENLKEEALTQIYFLRLEKQAQLVAHSCLLGELRLFTARPASRPGPDPVRPLTRTSLHHPFTASRTPSSTPHPRHARFGAASPACSRSK